MLEDDVTAFGTACRAAGLSPRTCAWYATNLARLVKFAHTRSVDTALLRESIAEMQSRDLSSATVRGYIRTLKRFYHWCCDEERLVADPSERIVMPRAPKRVPRGVAMSDFTRLLDAAATARDRAFLFALADTGCRVSEICNARLCDLNLKDGILLVCGKGNQERFVFLSSPTCEALRAWLNARQSETDWLFTKKDGGRFVYTTARELLRRLKAKVNGVGRCNPHAFRHGFAREYLLNGGDLASLSDLLGHRDIATTKIYAVFARDDLKKKHAAHSPIARLEKTT